MALTVFIERILDSVILIDHLNGIEVASGYLQGLDPSRTAISVITRAEILVGCHKKDVPKVKGLLDEYTLLVIDGIVADKAAELRRLRGWRLPDAFQAALAILHNAKLATRNTRDFDIRRDSFVEIPYTLR